MITFHVIYTPGTAIGLSRFALTLLQEPGCQLRIVSNGCTSAENNHLRALCDNNERLAYFQLPTQKIWHHPKVLNELQADWDEAYFAIIDSDIFATGPFLPESFSAELTCSLPFAAFWDRKEEAVRASRQHMGSTYFAIYDNKAVSKIREEIGISFDKYRWDLLTPQQQEMLNSINFKKRFYDTAKLLNAQLLANGGRIEHLDAGNLHHLGGTSRAQFSRQPFYLKQLRRMIKFGIMPSPRLLFNRKRKREAKVNSGAYFSDLLDALIAGDTLPTLPTMGDSYVEEKMRQMTADIVALNNQQPEH